MFFGLMKKENLQMVFVGIGVFALILVACGLFSYMALDLGGPLFLAVVIIAVYVAEMIASWHKDTSGVGLFLWPLHLCCMIGLYFWLCHTGYIDTGFEWEEEMGHGNFDYHQEPASCWNIFWWLGGIRLTVIELIYAIPFIKGYLKSQKKNR